MSDRKMLAWTGLVVSVLGCCPCALVSGFIMFAGAGSEMYPSDYSTGNPGVGLAMVAFFALATLALLAIGVFFFVWSVRTLLAPAAEDGERETTG